MQNLDLTKWLDMVWQALNEPDEVKRNRLLRAADMFLQKDNRNRFSLPPTSREKAA
jgi:hypothetical protein